MLSKNSSIVKVIPYSNFLHIKPLEKASVISSTQQRLQEIGEVLAIGKDVHETKVGDYIAFEKWDKPEFTYEDTTFHLIREQDVVCKVKLSQ